jgi:hypothetical protein
MPPSRLKPVPQVSVGQSITPHPWERIHSRRQWHKQLIRRGIREGKQVGCQAASRAFDFDLGRPVKPRWPNAELEPWATRQDAGLAALGQGWPFAAAHGSRSAVGYTEPRRGAEWWGKSVLLTFALSKVRRRKGATLSGRYPSNGYIPKNHYTVASEELQLSLTETEPDPAHPPSPEHPAPQSPPACHPQPPPHPAPDPSSCAGYSTNLRA